MRVLFPVLLIALFLATGCTRRGQEPVVAPPPPPPASAWAPADSRAVADELVPILLKRSWIGDYKQRTGQVPKVALGEISDRSQGAIDIEVFRGEVLRALAQGSLVQIIDARDQADYVLRGAVGAQDGVDGDMPVRRYQIDLTVVERVTGNVATPTVSIEKQKDDSVAPPAPTPTPAP